jgi:HK97 family phage major capsid protein
VSLELAEDWTLLNDQLGSLIQQAKDDLEATKFAVGAGTVNEPEGVVTGGTAVSTTAAFDLASDLYPVELALPARFRPNAVWLANRAQISSSGNLCSRSPARRLLIMFLVGRLR